MCRAATSAFWPLPPSLPGHSWTHSAVEAIDEARPSPRRTSWKARVMKKPGSLFLFTASARSERSTMMKDQSHTWPGRGSPSWHARWQNKHIESAKGSAHEGQPAEPPAFHHFLEAVRRQMQPEGRALHQAGMLQYLRTLLLQDVTLA